MARAARVPASLRLRRGAESRELKLKIPVMLKNLRRRNLRQLRGSANILKRRAVILKLP